MPSGSTSHRFRNNLRVWGLPKWTTLSNAHGAVMKWIYEQWWQDYRRSLRVLIWVMVYVCLRFVEPFSDPPRKQSRQTWACVSHRFILRLSSSEDTGKTSYNEQLKGIEVECCECHTSTSRRDQQNNESGSCDNVVSQDSEAIRLIVLYKAAPAQV